MLVVRWPQGTPLSSRTSRRVFCPFLLTGSANLVKKAHKPDRTSGPTFPATCTTFVLTDLSATPLSEEEADVGEALAGLPPVVVFRVGIPPVTSVEQRSETTVGSAISDCASATVHSGCVVSRKRRVFKKTHTTQKKAAGKSKIARYLSLLNTVHFFSNTLPTTVQYSACPGRYRGPALLVRVEFQECVDDPWNTQQLLGEKYRTLETR